MSEQPPLAEMLRALEPHWDDPQIASDARAIDKHLALMEEADLKGNRTMQSTDAKTYARQQFSAEIVVRQRARNACRKLRLDVICEPTPMS